MGISQQAAANLGGARPSSISIRQNRFTLIDESGNQEPIPPIPPDREYPTGIVLDVIIADANPAPARVCYLADFDPRATDHTPPDCFSNDGKYPDPSAGEAAGPYNEKWEKIAGGCANCWANKWGSEISKVTKKGVKKCKEGKALAVIPVGEYGHGKPFLLRVTPGARKMFGIYIGDLDRKKLPNGVQVDVSHVVTRLSFDQHVQGVLNFKAVGWAHETDIDLAPMYEAGEFAKVLGGYQTAPELLAPPLTPQIAHQNTTRQPDPRPEPPRPTPMPSAGKKFDLPFDDNIPF